MKTITRSYGAQRQLKALPRLSREGFVPAGRAGRRRSAPADMLCPKPEDRRYIRSETAEVPAMLLGHLGPAERIALREIAETGDIMQYGDKTYIVAAISATTLGTLAAFETELDEHELRLDHDEGVINEDREADHDDEPEHDGDGSPTGAYDF